MIDAQLTWLHAMGNATNSPLVLLILMGAAAIEYVVPPFPGDSIVLLGGVLVGAYAWSLPLVFTAVMLGSLFGSLLAFALGKRLLRRNPAIANGDGTLSKLVAQFHKRGSWFLLVNRFLPGIRPLFFVAAGLAGMSTRRVALLSAASAALWNAAIMVAGVAVGDNLERLENLLRTYSMFAWILVIVICIALAAKWLWKRRR